MIHSESAFETVCESTLLTHGFMKVDRAGFDPLLAIFPVEVIQFIKTTQAKDWAKIESVLGDKAESQILRDLVTWMDANGSLATLRHGFKCYGRTFRIAYFRAAHGLNPELEARYQANRIGITRQLQYSDKHSNSLDLTISVNGIPVATLELKNPMTGQNVGHAVSQYMNDRDPRETIFEFKKRTLVHFAVDPDEVRMTTRLAGKSTYFLPFNKGNNNGKGNPPDPEGRSYRTAYLWEEVLQRDSLLDLINRFLHLQIETKRTEYGQKVKKESMIFPRYHQLQAVRQIECSAKSEGPGHNYLIEHSAGSG